MFNKIKLYFFTIRYLTFTQVRYRIYYFLWAKFGGRRSFSDEKLPVSRSKVLQLEESLPAGTSVRYDNRTFSFLNLERSYKSNIDWNDGTHGKLWTYNLNYFEYLHSANVSGEDGLKLVEDFIEKINESKDGLEPYPISLRVIHWVKFLVYHKICSRSIDESLYYQLRVLVDKREYHILGNHLLENGFGLLFGAYYFSDIKLYRHAKDILTKELDEQVLPDGAHFELSPMYHQLMLYRVLDSHNLVKNNDVFGQELLVLLKEKAELMLGWLTQITFENGDIPLLNDSAFDINPTTKELVEYASRLGIQEVRKALSASGYRKVKTDNYEVVVDIGKIGPDYLPGHAHSDTFNFVLHAQGEPFIIDTGTSTYNSNERRLKERSTSSHNTVQVGNYEQSEIWGSFRVARRAYPVVLRDQPKEVESRIHYATNKTIRHQRKFSFQNEKIIIHDAVNSCIMSRAYFHFHPSIQVELKENILYTRLGTIKIDGAKIIELEDYQYAPTFNKLIVAKKAIITFEKSLTTTIEL